MASLAATSGSRTRGRFFGPATGSSGCSVLEWSGLLRLRTGANVYTERPSMGKRRTAKGHRPHASEKREKRASDRSLDHLISPSQHRRRDRESHCLGGLEIDDQLELGGLLDGQVGGLCALQNPVDEPGRATMHVVQIFRVGHEAPSLSESACQSYRGKPAL